MQGLDLVLRRGVLGDKLRVKILENKILRLLQCFRLNLRCVFLCGGCNQPSRDTTERAPNSITFTFYMGPTFTVSNLRNNSMA